MIIQQKLTALRDELKQAQTGYVKHENSIYGEQQAHCEQHGAYRQFWREMLMPAIRNQTRCPHCIKVEIEQLEQTELEQARQVRGKKIKVLLAQSGISKRFENARFANYQLTDKNTQALNICQQYANKWLDRQAQGGGLILCGKPGTGKNHLACAIVNQIIHQHQASVLIETALHIIRNVKSTWDKTSPKTEDEVMAFYAQKDLLIIDEIGVQFGSDAEKIILFEIINERYEQMKPTILISNLTEQELSAYVGERVIDRMREGKGVVVNFDWESFRK